MQKPDSSNIDRPVAESHLEIADTFEDAGTRPIEESPDFLVSNQANSENQNMQNIPQGNPIQSEINSTPPLD